MKATAAFIRLRIYLFALTNANSHVIAHAVQCAGEDDVVGAATVDEYFGQVDLANHRADHKGVSTPSGLVNLVVTAVEGDWRL